MSPASLGRLTPFLACVPLSQHTVMELSVDVEAQLHCYRKRVDELCAALTAALASPALAVTTNSTQPPPPEGGADGEAGPAAAAAVAPLDRAKAYLALARGVHALTSLLFKARGVDSNTKGPLPAELERIRQHGKKVGVLNALLRFSSILNPDASPSDIISIQAMSPSIGVMVSDLL